MILLLLALSLLLGISNSLSADPLLYFGGNDNNVVEYTDWLSQNQALYPKSIFLSTDADESLGIAVHWSILDDEIHIAVAARATGWVGFGIAEAGGMLGADIVYFTAATGELVDAHVLDQYAQPIPDDCQSWTLVDSFVGEDFTIFEGVRLLDTGDPQDRIFFNEASPLISTTRVIGAWGDHPGISYHGSTNRVRGAVRFFGEGDERALFAETMSVEAEASFAIIAQNYTIPKTDTTYAHFCYSTNDLRETLGIPIDERLHIIGLEPVISRETAQYVHHMVLTGMPFPWNGVCSTFPEYEFVFAAAKGEVPFNFPPEVGSVLGVGGGFLAFRLEIHYDNRWLDDVIDSSGVRLYWTRNLRPYDLGIMPMADPRFALKGRPVGGPNGGLDRHEFLCPSSCTEFAMQQNVTVIREYLHMHEQGARMYNDVIRDGEVVHTANVDYFDYPQQGIYSVIQEPYTLMPGDTFRTTCQYKTPREWYFGEGSQEEMCIAFVWYYPKQFGLGGIFPLTCGVDFGDRYGIYECEEIHSQTVLGDETELGRLFGVAAGADQCISPPSGEGLPTGVPTGAPSRQPTTSPSESPSSSPTGHERIGRGKQNNLRDVFMP